VTLFSPAPLVLPPATVVIGIDPGIAVFGVALVRLHGRSVDVISARAIRTNPACLLRDRIQLIKSELVAFIGASQPDLVCIEDQTPGQRGAQRQGHRNASAENVRRVIGLCEGLFVCPILEPTPAQVNRLIGLGRSRVKLSSEAARKRRKAAVRAWVSRVLGFEATSKDAADAVAVAVMGERIWRSTRAKCARGETRSTERIGGVS